MIVIDAVALVQSGSSIKSAHCNATDRVQMAPVQEQYYIITSEGVAWQNEMETKVAHYAHYWGHWDPIKDTLHQTVSYSGPASRENYHSLAFYTP